MYFFFKPTSLLALILHPVWYLPNSTAGPLYILSTIIIAIETCSGSDHFENTCKSSISSPPSIFLFFLSLLPLIDCILSMNPNVIILDSHSVFTFVILFSSDNKYTQWCLTIYPPTTMPCPNTLVEVSYIWGLQAFGMYEKRFQRKKKGTPISYRAETNHA